MNMTAQEEERSRTISFFSSLSKGDFFYFINGKNERFLRLFIRLNDVTGYVEVVRMCSDEDCHEIVPYYYCPENLARFDDDGECGEQEQGKK